MQVFRDEKVKREFLEMVKMFNRAWAEREKSEQKLKEVFRKVSENLRK